jgi:hypothetical protein
LAISNSAPLQRSRGITSCGDPAGSNLQLQARRGDALDDVLAQRLRHSCDRSTCANHLRESRREQLALGSFGRAKQDITHAVGGFDPTHRHAEHAGTTYRQTRIRALPGR